MINGREISSSLWMGAFFLVVAVAGSAALVAGEGRVIGRELAAAPAALAPDLSFVERGGRLFARSCTACHGAEGRGGIPNQNYIKDTVPTLSRLAKGAGGTSLKIFDKEEADEVVAALTEGKPEKIGDAALQAQYTQIRDVVRNGNPAGKKDPKGPQPPLNMPSWKGVLSDKDIDAILAYLLTVQQWEKE